ncbi:MAG: tRNA uridine-5-carboxymethylaminomethyl(34) synthesis GTPase MnmE, partial [Rhizobium rhizophilum]
MSTQTETIFALASGAVPAGVAVIRISGPASFPIVQALIGELPTARNAALRSVRTRDGEFLDRGLVLIFPGPASFTGEDCAELHLHGGRAVVTAVLRSLAGFPNSRLAGAGEFSRRAFENGKMDLVEVEGLADLLAAETEMQRQLASEQASGKLSAVYDGWREKLIFARSMLEAELDFSDEGDIPGSVSEVIWKDVAVLKSQIDDAIANLKAGEIIRDGFKVALAGPPNAGKSSLLNALAQRDVAIVTPIAGTTRDIVRCELDIEGYKVEIFDTAGLRVTEDPVEQEGIKRAYRTINQADLVLQLVDLSDRTADTQEVVPGAVRIGTKLDLADLRDQCDSVPFSYGVSSVTGLWLGTLRQYLV